MHSHFAQLEKQSVGWFLFFFQFIIIFNYFVNNMKTLIQCCGCKINKAFNKSVVALNSVAVHANRTDLFSTILTSYKSGWHAFRIWICGSSWWWKWNGWFWILISAKVLCFITKIQTKKDKAKA